MLLAAAAGLAGCAGEVVRTSATLTPDPFVEHARIAIAREVLIGSPGVFGRALPAGSVWELQGTLPQGRVYKRVNGIFTVEGAHVHEAFIVVSDNRLVGFYLPVERAYSPIQAVALIVR
jgi:hypothetical protein